MTLVWELLKFDHNGIKNFILSKGHALGIMHSIMIEKKIISKKSLFAEKQKGNIGNQLDIFNYKKNFLNGIQDPLDIQ